MILLNQVKLPVSHSEKEIRNKISKELNLRRIFKDMPSFDYKIIRRSVDARKKPDIFYTYAFAVDFSSIDIEKSVLKKCSNKNASKYEPNIYKPRLNIAENHMVSPVIVGEGPAGLFAGLVLSYAGYKPLIIERGDTVDNRVKRVGKFWETGILDENTNVQFGEGGAGTFSDGKLNTLVKDKTGKNQYVLDSFVRFGANPQVAYDAKPHVGTDVLADVVKNIREEIIRYGGRVINLCKLTDVHICNGAVDSICINSVNDTDIELGDGVVITPGINNIEARDVILATGHSARDTFRMLCEKNIPMQQKNFAVGIRIQHPQRNINDSQYGKGYSELLPPSPYKVTNQTSNNRSVFSFCMCPGGYVVNASSVKNHLCINGMSYSDRGSDNANSALIVAIDREDFGSDHVLAGMELQEELEKKAFKLGNGKIPVQLFRDFENNVESASFGRVQPVFKGDTSFANLREMFPDEINKALIESINKFGYTIEGFDDGDAILAAVESRTSSPVRIIRNDRMESQVEGIFPCGEGAGYAGGIMSAAIDGIKVAEALISKYSSTKN